MRVPTLAIVVLLSVAGSARADDRAEIARTTSAVNATGAALLAWAKTQPRDLPVARSIRELEPFLAVPSTDGSVAGAALNESELDLLAGRLEAIREGLARRAAELALGSAADPGDALETTAELFDVGPLINKVPDFPSWQPGLPTQIFGQRHPMAGATLNFGGDQGAATGLGMDADKLADMLRAVVKDGVTLSGGVVTVRGTAAELGAARAMLASLRAELTPRHLALDVRAYAMSRDTWTSLGPEGLVLGAEGERRLAAAEAGGRARLVGRQVLATMDGQVAGVSLGEVRTLLLPADASSVSSIVPVRYRTGLAVQTLTRLAPDRKSLLLTATIGFLELRGTTRVPVAGFEVALPECAFARARSETRIPLGRTALAAGSFSSVGEGTEDATGCLVLVTPSLAPSAPELAAPDPKTPAAAAKPALESTAAREAAAIEALVREVDAVIPLARGAVRFEALDVRDVLASHSDYPGPRLGQLSPEGDPNEEETGYAMEPEKLESFLKQETGWALGESSSYELHRGAILVRQTRTLLGRVREALEGLRAHIDRRASCEASIFRIDAALAHELEAGSKGQPGQLSPGSLALLDRTARAEPGRARLLAGGVVSGFEGQRVHVAAGRERVYVAGVAARREDAYLAGVRTGFVLDCRIGADQGGISASGRFSWTRDGTGEKVTAGGTPIEGITFADGFQSFEGVVAPGGAIVLTRQLPGDKMTIAIVIRPALEGPRR
jgi:hypothetical protein